MPLIRKEGKDTIIFASKEDHATPSTVEIPKPEPSPLLLPSGEINWDCPCLGGMAHGPCGVQFREAFSCFYRSTSEPKGTECFEAFRTMQDCMVQYPELYRRNGADDDDDDDDDEDEDEDLIEASTKNTEIGESNKNVKEQEQEPKRKEKISQELQASKKE